MKISINKETCIGCGACVATCSGIFELGDDNKAKVKVTEVPEKDQNCAKQGADACPVQAIEIKD